MQKLQIPEVGFCQGFSVAYNFYLRCLDVGMNPGLVDRTQKTSQEDADECDSQNGVPS